METLRLSYYYSPLDKKEDEEEEVEEDIEDNKYDNEEDNDKSSFWWFRSRLTLRDFKTLKNKLECAK